MPASRVARLAGAGRAGALGALARMGALAALAYAAWYQSYDFTGVLLLTAVWSVAAVGLALVLGMAGQMALCQASFMLLGAYAYAVPAADAGVPPLAALALAGLAGAVAAALLSPVLRIRGNYLALATIAVALLIDRAFRTGDWLPGGVSGFVGVPDLAVGGVTVASPDAYVAITVAVLAVSVAGAHWAFGRGERRRDVQLIHHDEGLLTAFGGSPLALKRTLFVVSGLLGGLSGALLGAAYGYIRPNGFGIAESFALALAVFIGGNGRLLGAVVGMAIYQLSYPVLGPDLAELRFLAMGVIVIAIVHASPQGLLPRLREVLPLLPHRLRPGKAAPAPTAAGPALKATTAATAPTATTAAIARTAPPAPPVVDPPPAPAIRLEGVTKRYGGLVAVDDLSVTVDGGALVALVGPNGAGKTTVLDLIAGEQRADAGEVWLGDVPVAALGADRRARLGLSRTFQRVRLVRGLNVLDNVTVGADRAAREGRTQGRDEASRKAAALAALESVGLAARAADEVQSLTFADRRLVEMARLLAARPRVALLDEPSSGLNDDEAEGFAELVRELRRTGCTVVLVEHNLPFVRSLADHVIALDSGRLLASGPTEEVFEVPDFVEAYVGAT